MAREPSTVTAEPSPWDMQGWRFLSGFGLICDPYVLMESLQESCRFKMDVNALYGLPYGARLNLTIRCHFITGPDGVYWCKVTNSERRRILEACRRTGAVKNLPE